MTEDRVLSAAEQDHADAIAMFGQHRQQCGACNHPGCTDHPRCPECIPFEEHVRRSAEQIDLLRVPGETGELF